MMSPASYSCLLHLLSSPQEMVVGDQSGVIHIWNLQNDQSEPIIPDPKASIQHIAIDPQVLLILLYLLLLLLLFHLLLLLLLLLVLLPRVCTWQQ